MNYSALELGLFLLSTVVITMSLVYLVLRPILRVKEKEFDRQMKQFGEDLEKIKKQRQERHRDDELDELVDMIHHEKRRNSSKLRRNNKR